MFTSVTGLVLIFAGSPAMPLQRTPLPSAMETLPAGPDSMAPSLFRDRERDTIHMTWLEPVKPEEAENKSWQVRYARRDKQGWSKPVTVVERDDLFVNWADTPTVASATDGAIVVSWLQKSGPDTYAYDAVVARSTDDGKTWKNLGPLHDDGTQTEHGFVSLVPEGEAVRAFWLDGRAMTADAHGHGGGDMMIRTAVVEETIHSGSPLDRRVCECCNTAAVGTSKGPIVAYRDRSDEEVRDISVVRIEGLALKHPVVVHDDGWSLEGCPVNGPAMDNLDDTVALAWYTGAGDDAVQVVFTDDDGELGDPIAVAGAAALGRVDVLMYTSDQAVVSWIEADGEKTLLKARLVNRSGESGTPVTLAKVPPGRPSGFPKLERAGDTLLIVWTSTNRNKGLEGARVPLLAIPAP